MPNRLDTGASAAAPASVSASLELMTPNDNQPTQADRNNPGMGASSDTDEENLSPTVAATINQPSSAASENTTSIQTTEQATASDSADSPGLAFITWLRHAILTRKILLNDAKALVHTVDDTIFLVSPGIFMRYAQEHPHLAAQAKAQEMPDWQWVQKQFEKSRLHRKQPDGLNIWTCEVSGPRKSRRLHGYLLQTIATVMDESIPNNPFLSVKDK